MTQSMHAVGTDRPTNDIFVNGNENEVRVSLFVDCKLQR